MRPECGQPEVWGSFGSYGAGLPTGSRVLRPSRTPECRLALLPVFEKGFLRLTAREGCGLAVGSPLAEGRCAKARRPVVLISESHLGPEEF